MPSSNSQSASKRLKILVFIDHDIIIRHFLMSGALAPLAASEAVKFVFPKDLKKRVSLDVSSLPLGGAFEEIPIDAKRQLVWRWILFADLLKFRLGRHEASIRRTRRQALGWKAALALTVASIPPFSILFRLFTQRELSRRPALHLDELLSRESPDLVLHPTALDGVFSNDLVDLCAARGVPLIMAMNSWDNPATKRTVVGQPDRLLVWGQQTKEHAERFMRIAPERVVPFGAAQFDVFALPPRLSRRDFAVQHDIDPAKRIVLFAGSNAQTDEFSTLNALDDAIERGDLGNLAVVYRPHPWGNGGRGGERLASATWKHIKLHGPTVNYIQALARGDDSMSLPDYRDTHDVLSVVDAVLSPLSTILIEAVLHSKPVVVYAPAEPASDIANKLPKIHFDEFLRLEDVLVARSPTELISATNKAFDAGRGERLKNVAQYFVSAFERPWAERIVQEVHRLARDQRV